MASTCFSCRSNFAQLVLNHSRVIGSELEGACQQLCPFPIGPGRPHDALAVGISGYQQMSEFVSDGMPKDNPGCGFLIFILPEALHESFHAIVEDIGSVRVRRRKAHRVRTNPVFRRRRRKNEAMTLRLLTN